MKIAGYIDVLEIDTKRGHCQFVTFTSLFIYLFLILVKLGMANTHAMPSQEDPMHQLDGINQSYWFVP